MIGPSTAVAAVAPELIGLVSCPSCHVEDRSITNLAVSRGAYFRCARCSSRWDGRRLATVAAYASWVSDHPEMRNVTSFVRAIPTP